MNNVAGLGSSGSQRAMDMRMKIQYINEKNQGRGVIMATGTPLSNSMVELYVMQLYLQERRLHEKGIYHFDAWASVFGEVTSSLELAPEGTGYRMRTRFNKFINLPELIHLFKEVADIILPDMLDIKRPELKDGKYKIVVSEASDYVKERMQEMVKRAEAIHRGAVDPKDDNITIAAFEAIGTLSTNNNPPEKASRPFDDTRNGFVLAEAAGILVLEELGHALNRGAHIYGEIGGYGSVNNAMHMTGLKPDGEDLSRAIKIAIEEANITPFEIDYINAHGSGTKQNDINETGAYKKVFGELAYKIPMSSTKSMTGHPLGAASAVEAIVCCLALENNFMPPTINYNKKDALCDLDYIPNCGREKNLNVVLTNASGFGGLHAAMILKKYID